MYLQGVLGFRLFALGGVCVGVDYCVLVEVRRWIRWCYRGKEGNGCFSKVVC